MNKKTMLALLLVLATTAAAQDFSNENTSETPDQQTLAYDSSTVLLQTTRHFTVTEEVNITAELVTDAPTGYTVDLYFSDDGTNYTQVAAGVNDTTTSSPATINGTATFRADVHLPATREASSTLAFDFLLVLDVEANQGGNGGTQQPSLAHRLEIYYNDPTYDSDADMLPDEWEEEQFGDLNQSADDDPDEDGFTNSEEFIAGSDPNNAASRPEGTIIGGGGGSVDVSDREVVHIILGAFAFFIIAAVVSLVLTKASEEKTAGIWSGIVISGVVVAGVVITALDVTVLAGDGWQWYSVIGINWLEASILGVTGIIGAVALWILFATHDQREESRIAAFGFPILIGVLALLGAAFWYWDIPIPDAWIKHVA